MDFRAAVPPCAGNFAASTEAAGLVAAKALYAVLSPPHLGQGSLPRNALQPASNISYCLLCAIYIDIHQKYV